MLTIFCANNQNFDLKTKIWKTMDCFWQVKKKTSDHYKHFECEKSKNLPRVAALSPRN